jgi:hypothetical protein
LKLAQVTLHPLSFLLIPSILLAALVMVQCRLNPKYPLMFLLWKQLSTYGHANIQKRTRCGKKMEALRVSLSSQKTSQTVINVIIDGLQGWRHGVDHVFNITTTAGMLGDVQNKMGWEHFFEGRPHKHGGNIIPVNEGQQKLTMKEDVG